MVAVLNAEREALSQLRRARRSHRAAEVDVFDAFYQAYLTAIGCGVVVLLASDVVGDKRVGAVELGHVMARGPAVIGVALAVLAVGGVRSGVRGGPLVLPAADVRHVLLSPVSRSVALQGPAIRHVRFAAFVGAVTGAIGGVLASHRLPGGLPAWAACGATAGVLSALLVTGCALVASGLRLPRWAVAAALVGMVGWAGADAVTGAQTSPTTALGVLALWPVHFGAVGLAGFVLPIGVAIAGIAVVGGSSVEAAERRSSLASQIRFALTLQDLRTVVLLRRQLTQEHPRSTPWVSLRALGHGRFLVWRRDLRGLTRWPFSRVARVVVLGGIAGLAMVGVWNGTTPLLVVGALALYIAGLDALEPLAQDIDHPDVAGSVPIELGRIRLLHVPASLVTLFAVVVVGWGVALLIGPASISAPVGAAMLAPAALLATAGGATSIVMGPPAAASLALPVEVAGAKMVLRVLWSPALVVLGLTPLLVARSSSTHGVDPGPAAVSASIFPIMVAALALAWLRFREHVHEWIKMSTHPEQAR